jgi:hypothetical protein
MDNPTWSGNMGVLLWTASDIGRRQFHSSGDSTYSSSTIHAFLRNGWNAASQTFFNNGLWSQTNARLSGNSNHPLTGYAVGGAGADQRGANVTARYFLLSAHELANAVYFPNMNARVIGPWYWTRSAVTAANPISVNIYGQFPVHVIATGEGAIPPAILLI